jgi:hypothetical protein
LGSTNPRGTGNKSTFSPTDAFAESEANAPEWAKMIRKTARILDVCIRFLGMENIGQATTLSVTQLQIKDRTVAHS